MPAAASRILVGQPVLLTRRQWLRLLSAARELDVRRGGCFDRRGRRAIVVWEETVDACLEGFPSLVATWGGGLPLGLFVAHFRGDGRIAVTLELVVEGEVSSGAEPDEGPHRTSDPAETEPLPPREERLAWRWRLLGRHAAGSLVEAAVSDEESSDDEVMG